MKRLGHIVIVLTLIGLLVFGGREYAKNEGWIAGKPNSPRAENFKRALDNFLPRLVDPAKLLCATMGFSPSASRTSGFPDTAFNWSPTEYLARLEQTPRPIEFRPERLELLARHGYLEARPGSSGIPDYSLSWKGYARSNRAGCLYLTGIDYDVRIISFRKARVENGLDVYEVVAQPLPGSVEPWVKDADFSTAFDPNKFAALLDPAPVTYELARAKQGFVVLGEKGMQRHASPHPSAVEAQPLETLDPARVRRAIDEYLARGGGIRNPVCLSLDGGVDEMTYETNPTGARVPVTIAVYNIRERSGDALQKALLSYEMLRRLESVGLAKSELLAAGSFKRQIAAGGVRFELTEKGKSLLWHERTTCLLVGTAEIQELVMVQQFSEAIPRPRFIARASLKLKEGMEPIVEKFRYLERMIEPGLPVFGVLQYDQGQLKVETMSQASPQFYPDLAEVRLPVIEAAVSSQPPSPGTPSLRSVPRSDVPVAPSRSRHDTRVIRCGGDIIVCDDKDVVVCRGRTIRCPGVPR